MKRVSFFIAERQHERLQDVATENGISAAELIRNAIERVLSDNTQEEIADLKVEVRELKKRIEKLEKLEKSAK